MNVYGKIKIRLYDDKVEISTSAKGGNRGKEIQSFLNGFLILSFLNFNILAL